ncbi:hypothetical protein [Stenotrophomonas bentonitica]
MRTPTAFLCIGAVFGNKDAQRTLEHRRALKTSFITNIGNINREWKETRRREGFRNPLDMPPPRSEHERVPRDTAGHAAHIRTLVNIGRGLDVRRPALPPPRARPLPSQWSWLHHGPT